MSKITLTYYIHEQNTAFGVKIQSNCLAYSNLTNEMTFWQSGDTFYNLWGDNLTISGNPDIKFVEFINPKSILCNQTTAKLLNMSISKRGQVISKYINKPKKNIAKTYFENAKSFYELFANSEMDFDYQGFVLDLSLKMRNGIGTNAGIYKDKKLIAAAVCPYITDKYALISAVAVAKSEQNKGNGTKVLELLEEQLSGRTIFLLKEQNKNNCFYAKCGYKEVDNWVIGSLK